MSRAGEDIKARVQVSRHVDSGSPGDYHLKLPLQIWLSNWLSNRLAVASPIPREAPVTSTVCPSNPDTTPSHVRKATQAHTLRHLAAQRPPEP